MFSKDLQSIHTGAHPEIFEGMFQILLWIDKLKGGFGTFFSNFFTKLKKFSEEVRILTPKTPPWKCTWIHSTKNLWNSSHSIQIFNLKSTEQKSKFSIQQATFLKHRSHLCFQLNIQTLAFLDYTPDNRLRNLEAIKFVIPSLNTSLENVSTLINVYIHTNQTGGKNEKQEKFEKFFFLFHNQ